MRHVKRLDEEPSAQLRAVRPDASGAALDVLTQRGVARPDGAPPPSTGGAVAAVLIDTDGDEVETSARFEAASARSRRSAGSDPTTSHRVTGVDADESPTL